MRGLSQTTTTIETYGRKKKSGILGWLKFIGMLIFAILMFYYFGPIVAPMLIR
jgi:hypothetical protein